MRPTPERLEEIRQFSDKTIQSWSAMECSKEDMIHELLEEIDALRKEALGALNQREIEFEQDNARLRKERDDLKAQNAWLEEGDFSLIVEGAEEWKYRAESAEKERDQRTAELSKYTDVPMMDKLQNEIDRLKAENEDQFLMRVNYIHKCDKLHASH